MEPKTVEKTEAGSDLVGVYEVVNETRREIFIAVSADMPNDLERLHTASPPTAIRHWKATDKKRYQAIDYAFPRGKVWDFVKAYAKTAVHKDWTILF